MKDEAFLEDINNILSSGEVPNLYVKDEKAAILEEMRPIAKRHGNNTGTPDELWALFIERVRANLHVVLCMSPIGESFRNRLRQYPAFVNTCTIDWFLEWPLDALREVAQRFLEDVRFGDAALISSQAVAAAAATAAGTPQPAVPPTLPEVEVALKGRIAAVFASAHKSVSDASARMLLTLRRHNYVTPTSYLELVLGYRDLLKEKKKELGDARDKLANGLAKLESSKEQVVSMQHDLSLKQKVVEKASAECDALLVKIVQEKRVADEQRAEVEETSQRIALEVRSLAGPWRARRVCTRRPRALLQEGKCKEIADEANADLAEALPALEKAMAEVG